MENFWLITKTQLKVQLVIAFWLPLVLLLLISIMLEPKDQTTIKLGYIFSPILLSFICYTVFCYLKISKLLKNGVFLKGKYRGRHLCFDGGADYEVEYLFNNQVYNVILSKNKDYEEFRKEVVHLIINPERPDKDFICLPEKDWTKKKKEIRTRESS